MEDMEQILTYIGTLKKGEPTILFIPGAMTTPKVYEGLANYLPCQSAIIDWNHSQGPWEVETIGKKVIQLIENLELGTTILCGYSMGGVISIAAAINDTKGIIKGMMIANTGASAQNHGDPDFPCTLAELWPNQEVFDNFVSRCFALPISKGMYLTLKEYAWELPKETVCQAAKSVRESDFRDRLCDINCPVLLLYGYLDKSRTEEHVKELIQGISNIELIRLECGHTPMVEQREQYLGKLLYFLEKLNIAKSEDYDMLHSEFPNTIGK